jgi:hypothetical protein
MSLNSEEESKSIGLQNGKYLIKLINIQGFSEDKVYNNKGYCLLGIKRRIQ